MVFLLHSPRAQTTEEVRFKNDSLQLPYIGSADFDHASIPYSDNYLSYKSTKLIAEHTAKFTPHITTHSFSHNETFHAAFW